MSSESEARAALRSLGYRLSGYKGGFTILDAEQTYVIRDEDGAARRLSLEEVTAWISEFRESGGQEPGRRALSRRRVLNEAKVLLSDWTVIDCLIRDMTELGAKLAFAGATELPAEFRLLIVAQNLMVPVELEWQRGLDAGVRLRGPGRNAPPRKW